MTISVLCNKVVVTIPRHVSVDNAARLMRENHVGDVVVIERADSRVPVGILTDRDIAIEVVAQALAPARTEVGSVMSTPVLLLREDDGFLQALDKMSARGVRRAPVVDQHGHLKGVVSVDDLVPLLARELAKIGALIRHGQAVEVEKIENAHEDEYAA